MGRGVTESHREALHGAWPFIVTPAAGEHIGGRPQERHGPSIALYVPQRRQ
jgi:hypothetical protein